MGIMLQRTLPAGFIAPCLPTKTDKLASKQDNGAVSAGQFVQTCSSKISGRSVNVLIRRLRVLSGGTRRKRRDRQRLTGDLEVRFEHRSNLGKQIFVAKSISQYHREDNQMTRSTIRRTSALESTLSMILK